MQRKCCRAKKFVIDIVLGRHFFYDLFGRGLLPPPLPSLSSVSRTGQPGPFWIVSLIPSTVLSLAFSHQHQTSPVRTRDPPARSRTHTILLLLYTYVYGVRAYVWRSIVRAYSSFSLNRSRWSTRAPPLNRHRAVAS